MTMWLLYCVLQTNPKDDKTQGALCSESGQAGRQGKSYPEKLSGGEKQRVAIARAFASDPKLIIADEPTANIDPALSYDIVKLLKEINKCGTTVIMVTHEHSLVEYFGGRIVSLKNGEVIFDEYVEGEAQDE